MILVCLLKQLLAQKILEDIAWKQLGNCYELCSKTDNCCNKSSQFF